MALVTPTLRDDDAEPRTGAALRIWSETTPIKGTLAERYFVEHRKLNIRPIDLDHVLRWDASIF
jgi:hypothetical protein